MVMTTDMNDPPITAMFALAYLNVVFQKCKHTLAMQVDPLQGHSCAIQYATNGLRTSAPVPTFRQDSVLRLSSPILSTAGPNWTGYSCSPISFEA